MVFAAKTVGLEGSGVVADEDREDAGDDDDEKPFKSSPFSEDVFDDVELEVVEIVIFPNCSCGGSERAMGMGKRKNTQAV